MNLRHCFTSITIVLVSRVFFSSIMFLQILKWHNFLLIPANKMVQHEFFTFSCWLIWLALFIGKAGRFWFSTVKQSLSNVAAKVCQREKKKKTHYWSVGTFSLCWNKSQQRRKLHRTNWQDKFLLPHRKQQQLVSPSSCLQDKTLLHNSGSAPLPVLDQHCVLCMGPSSPQCSSSWEGQFMLG